MNKEIEIPEGYEARIEGNKVILEKKEVESENERIRKELLAFAELHIYDFKKYKYSRDENVQQIISWWKNIIAYLKKQKEHKPSVEEVLIKAGLHPYKDGNQWCILIGDNIQEGICGFGDTIDDALYHLLREAIAYQKEQKPAEWSEEEVQKLNRITAILYEAGTTKCWYEKKRICEREEADSLCAFLKSIYSQSKQEWSEEDDDYLMDVKAAVNDYFDEGYAEELCTWLKSLRPQPHWKPNNFELGALRTAISILTEERNFQCTGKHLRDILDHFEGKETQYD